MIGCDHPLTSSSDGVTYTYDDNGNTLTKTEAAGLTQYGWDYENRLTSVTLPGGPVVTFKYDPFGRRIQKASAAGVTNYVYDGVNITEEVDAAGLVQARYAQGPGIDEPVAMQRGGSLDFFAADGLGSVTSLTDASGTIGASYTYESFGGLLSTTGTLANPVRYTGREYDAETGMFYYRARYYDANAGRFISEDPIRFQGGIDFYTYAGNNPINLDDPSGLQYPYEYIAHNASNMGPSQRPEFCDRDKNCRMFITCGPTPRTHGWSHCTVIIQNGPDYTVYDGEPSGDGPFGGTLWGRLIVIDNKVKYRPDEAPPGPNTFVNAAVPCDCAKREADAINSSALVYNAVFQNSNSIAAMIAAACGVYPENWPSWAWGSGNNTPLPIQ